MELSGTENPTPFWYANQSLFFSMLSDLHSGTSWPRSWPSWRRSPRSGTWQCVRASSGTKKTRLAFRICETTTFSCWPETDERRTGGTGRTRPRIWPVPWTSLPSCTPGELSDWVWLILRVWDCGPFYVDTTQVPPPPGPPPPVAETTAASSGASTAEPATAAASAPSTAEPATAAASAPSTAEPATAAASAPSTAEPVPAEAEHSNMFRARLGVHVQVAGFAVGGHSAQVDWDCGALC